MDFQYEFDLANAPAVDTLRSCAERISVYYALVVLLLQINTYSAIRVLAKPEQSIITDSMAAFRLQLTIDCMSGSGSGSGAAYELCVVCVFCTFVGMCAVRAISEN